uniref:Prefoldin subunit 3 n=1 Tax=Aureoumbra lagunensis TaxID=44058 RepID=A0A7S3NQ37_9STRA|mmetsp:Transcript_7747/g.10794  ORF Transcript_7747/g.10794 Transcript_7747/m.10794 type:complete len:229 (+) Transcript_7747:157-843(+)|eukprot:CAMPEP_0197293240 /NCGR_PEP_ID=MMETSP0890-20130614/27491_1 /TAXON_ID=44058 ORGANISM="Aureoumbra lagunensis, Strain CCMP1510" /NCGR_SAMPLE_ID=MMETSP0890 /ASSEMBLY_ACC=CAM_ASM_000533 /LENGTH=228 /DNA_ID=CAMNT_0042767813 /DNA_START=125 /DNA_END=811 /DNA_ORIENTATION=+
MSEEKKEVEELDSALKEGGNRTEDASEQFKDLKMATILTSETNERGIPKVIFIESVEKLLEETENSSVETLIGAFNELHQKFKLLESHKVRTKKAMAVKIPEIERTLQLVDHLIESYEKNEELTTHYSLSEMLYARAKIHTNGVVALWLGAQVMVEYPYDEAKNILTTSLKNAKLRRDICDQDIDHIRDQIITVEVNMARVFNFDVKRRRHLKDTLSTANDQSSALSS